MVSLFRTPVPHDRHGQENGATDRFEDAEPVWSATGVGPNNLQATQSEDGRGGFGNRHDDQGDTPQDERGGHKLAERQDLHKSVGWELGHDEAGPEGCRLRTVSEGSVRRRGRWHSQLRHNPAQPCRCLSGDP